MASISSLNSIKGLNLWLDATDLSTIITSFSQTDLIQWNDKSSNAYQFIPVRSNDRPIISTNGISSVAILFNQTSSFHLLSKEKIPANSTLDFFTVITPYSLWGPRQPIFDSADITVAETDTRFNTQIYADGNEFFRGITAANVFPPTQNYANAGVQDNGYGTFQATAIYEGNLYIGTSVDYNDVNRIYNSNYLQIYNRKSRVFELWSNALSDNGVRSLAVYDNKLFATTNSTLSVYYSGNSNFVVPRTFISTSFNSTDKGNYYGYPVNIFGMNKWFYRTDGFPGGGPMCVYNRELYTSTYAGWLGSNRGNSSVAANCNTHPQLYKWSMTTSTISLVTPIRYSWYNQGNTYTEYTQFQSGLFSFKGDMYITGSVWNFNTNGYMFRFNDNRVVNVNRNGNYFNNANLGGGSASYLGVYYGSMIVPIQGETYRLYKWNENRFQNFGRTNYVSAVQQGPGIDQNATAGGGMCAYKGNLWLQRSTYINNSNSYGNNYVEIYTGSSGGSYSNSIVRNAGANPVNNHQNNLMIVHDGKIFMNAFSKNIIYEWGNGTSLDKSFSTLVGAPILLHIRKTPNISQMFLNGTLVQTENTNFTFSDQPSREMWIGGAAGTMAGGMSDSGSDHMQGAIHTIAQYNQVLSMTDRQKVEGILAWKFGIQNILPASHPYVNSSP